MFSHLSLGSLLAVYLCISATILSLWFPNSFFSALSLATSEALGPLLFSASCTVFREDSICWKYTLCHTPLTFNTLLPNASSLGSVFLGSLISSMYQLDTLPKVRSKKWKLSGKFQGWHKLNTCVLRAETTTLLVSTKLLPQELNLTETLNP